MSYTVQFLGLTCFAPSKEGMVALLPDGRIPPPQIPPHIASIAVNTRALIATETQGWEPGQIEEDGEVTQFFFRPSRIFFPMDADQPLTGNDLPDGLGRIEQVDERFGTGFDSNWIARVGIAGGALEIYRLPNAPAVTDTDLLVRWTVPYDGKTITIRLIDRKGWPERTITVGGGSEIAVVNMSRGAVPANGPSHFKVYQELSVRTVQLEELPQRAPVVWNPLVSRLALHVTPRPASGVDGGGCSARTISDDGTI